jgi:hypothetical protein
MKKLILLFFAGILLTTISYAQNRNGLTGPKAKNYKSWQDKSKSDEASTAYTTTSKQLTGPQAKNKHLRKSQAPVEYTAVSTLDRPAVTGPKAKNWKPGHADRNTSSDIVTNKAVPEKKKKQDEAADNDNR